MKHHSRKREKYAVKTRNFSCQNNSPETNPASSTISNGSFSALKRLELDADNPPSFSARWRMAGAMPPLVLYACIGIFIYEVKERLEPLPLLPFLGLHDMLQGEVHF
jgi:hypothetical protein